MRHATEKNVLYGIIETPSTSPKTEINPEEKQREGSLPQTQLLLKKKDSLLTGEGRRGNKTINAPQRASHLPKKGLLFQKKKFSCGKEGLRRKKERGKRGSLRDPTAPNPERKKHHSRPILQRGSRHAGKRGKKTLCPPRGGGCFPHLRSEKGGGNRKSNLPPIEKKKPPF